jgi:hypothetical protein
MGYKNDVLPKINRLAGHVFGVYFKYVNLLEYGLWQAIEMHAVDGIREVVRTLVVWGALASLRHWLSGSRRQTS